MKRLIPIILIGISGFAGASDRSNGNSEIKKVLSESSIASKVWRHSGFIDVKGNPVDIKQKLSRSADSVSSSNDGDKKDRLKAYPPHIVACLTGKAFNTRAAHDGAE